jgi:hypothetical protein
MRFLQMSAEKVGKKRVDAHLSERLHLRRFMNRIEPGFGPSFYNIAPDWVIYSIRLLRAIRTQKLDLRL